jgi:rod shape determining protein RodA
MFQLDRRILIHFDYLIPLLLIPIIATSCWLIGEINENMVKKELSYILIGIIVFFVASIFPIRKFMWIAPIAYWLDIALLISVKFFGTSILGAKRWLAIPFTSMTIQPSELMKPAILLMLAYLVQKHPPRANGYDWREFGKMAAFIMLPFVLIAIEPDLGSAMVVALLGFGVLFLIGVKWRIWITLLLALAICSTFLYGGLRDYQKQRIKDFVAEKPSYHVQQSIIAIGSGGMFGKEKDDATQVQLKFLPIATTDFIFAYFVERFGFVGSIVLLAIYGSLIIHILSLISVFKNDAFGVVFAGGIAILFFVYVSVNVAMTIGMAPVVGIPLPLFSYGGTSFLNFMILLGILENLLAFRFNFLYNPTSTFFGKRKKEDRKIFT